jgi:hypothetical protein
MERCLQRAKRAVARHIDDDISITRVAWPEHKRETSMLYERVAQVDPVRKALLIRAAGPAYR